MAKGATSDERANSLENVTKTIGNLLDGYDIRLRPNFGGENTSFDSRRSKVKILWEVHIFFWIFFPLFYKRLCQVMSGADFEKFCGLLRRHELY